MDKILPDKHSEDQGTVWLLRADRGQDRGVRDDVGLV